MRVGDIIVAIDERPATELTLSMINDLFLIPEREYLIRFIRRSRPHEVSLVTRPLLPSSAVAV